MDKIYQVVQRYVMPEEEVRIISLRHPNSEAIMAIELLGRWGMVAAMPDGEDSTGRQQMRLQTPDELVTRAVEVARLAFLRFEEAGWMLALPVPKLPEKTG